MEDVKIQWHPGFVAAVDLELRANRGQLVYEKEYNLNRKPLQIDLLVIKKSRRVRIENEIGRLFRGYNIMEYKSPQDRLDIDAFYKTEAYAGLYKAYGGKSDGRKAEDITVSLVRETRPVGLFLYFREHGIPVVNFFPGIYYVLNKVPFLTQIIVTGELMKENHAWLAALSDQMDRESMRSFLERVQGLEERYERELADAVLEVSTSANRQIVEELRGDESMKALMKLMEPEINQIVEEAVESAERTAREEEAVRTVTNLLKSGKLSAEEIAECVPRLSPKEVRMIAERLIRA